MSYGRITTETMTDIADAIRDKTGSEAQVTPTQMPERIRSIQTGNPNAVLYVEQELTEEEKAQARDNIGAVGEDGIPIVPTNISAFNNDSDYQTAQQVQTAISGVRQLPAVTAADNGKSLVVENGAWAVGSGGSGLPDATSASAGDFLRLDAQKNAAWETVLSVMGASIPLGN